MSRRSGTSSPALHRTGLPTREPRGPGRALLPHGFTLAKGLNRNFGRGRPDADASTEGLAVLFCGAFHIPFRGIPGITRRPALRCPDFPQQPKPLAMAVATALPPAPQ